MVERREGSIKDGRVAVDLLMERANINFDQEEMQLFFHHDQQNIDEMKDLIADMHKYPDILVNSPKFYEMDPDEQRMDLLKRA
jgi:hypothetical protein